MSGGQKGKRHYKGACKKVAEGLKREISNEIDGLFAEIFFTRFEVS